MRAPLCVIKPASRVSAPAVNSLPLLGALPAAPLALAFSGGGDSAALLHLLKGRREVDRVFIVDHGLRSGSAQEARLALSRAKAMGYPAEVMRWEGPKPQTALQEKARHARYSLLGRACRRYGLSYLVTGHTRDDQAETILMRYARKTGWRGAAGMAAVSPHPLWPELAGLHLLRPLLGTSRQVLRDYLSGQGAAFISDPSNQNRDFARIRARDYLASRADLREDLLAVATDLQTGLTKERRLMRARFARDVKISNSGCVSLKRPVPKVLLSRLLLAAAGRGGIVELDRFSRLSTQMQSPAFRAATLAGAQVTRGGEDGFLITREPSAFKGRASQAALAPLSLSPGAPTVLWDGRWWIKAGETPLTITPLFGHQAALPKDIAQAVRDLPAPLRPSIPAIWQDGRIIAAGHYGAELGQKCAILPRLETELGINAKES